MTQVIETDSAPKAIGPYSQAIKLDRLVFCSGQVGLDPATGALVDGGVEGQARQGLANLAEVLSAAGSGLQNVVKTTVFLTSMDDFEAMNAVYAEAVGDNRPARSTVAVKELPKAALFEIEAIAAS